MELFEENARLHSMLEAHNIHDTLAPVNLNAKAAAEASAAAKHSQTLVGQVRANMGDEAMFQDDHRNKSPVVSNGHASPLTDTDSAPSPYTMFAGGTTKLMMATTLIALFFFGTSPLIAAPAEHVFASAGGGRVLNSIELEHVGVAAAAGAWFMQYGVWWVLRAVVLFVGVLIGLARDPMSQSDVRTCAFESSRGLRMTHTCPADCACPRSTGPRAQGRDQPDAWTPRDCTVARKQGTTPLSLCCLQFTCW